ncbi:hypothetical protein SUGI_0701090 [Cryptomeria japonica]|nr:hypothetical protein SUGI_0701090 [Cryptomeria japonica]
MVKLENQIPLFVLIRILEIGFKYKEIAVSALVQLLAAYKQFRGFPSLNLKLRLRDHIQNGASHLLDLSRRLIKDFLTDSSSASVRNGSAKCDFAASARINTAKCTSSCCNAHFVAPSSSPSDHDFTPSAEKLNKAGVKFEGRWLQIVSRNCTIISTYMHLMDDLIDTSEDVGLLKKGKIIKSLVGSDEEVVGMVNDLCKGVTVFLDHQYKEVGDEVRNHYNSQLKLWISEFTEEYWSKPWYVVSLVAATLLLGMTAVQTIFTVKG